jgi:DHA2 family multidrug resistance protein
MAAPPPRKKDGAAPTFVGFLYLSAGLALMFAALQQGERLEWWRSGVFSALFWSGAFFILRALIRRLCGPNALVALP